MSWAVGYDTNWQRDIGYGVPATCDYPYCGEKIYRGLDYVCCESQPCGGDNGCGLYFCDAHPQRCVRCRRGKPPFTPTPDLQEWIDHKETHPSWAQWRIARRQTSFPRTSRREGDRKGTFMTNPTRVEKPLVPAGQKKEVIVVLDTSGSMEWEAAENSPVSRWSVITEAMPLFIAALEAQDTEAASEQAGGSDEKGGLLIHGFSNLHTALGDFNSSNFARKWPAIRVGGGTTIMPAWRAAQEDYMDEFGDRDAMDRPALLTLVITDGEATDAAEFATVLTAAPTGRYFAIAIVGHGDAHDQTLASYRGAADANPKHVTVLSFDSVTNPRELADDLIVMAGLAQ